VRVNTIKIGDIMRMRRAMINTNMYAFLSGID